MNGREGLRVRCVVVAGALAVMLAAGEALAEKQPFERILPETVWAYATLDDVPGADAAVRALPLGKVLEEPLIKKYVDDAWKKIEKGFSEAEPFKDSGLKLKDLVDHCSQGQVAVVLFSWDLPRSIWTWTG